MNKIGSLLLLVLCLGCSKRIIPTVVEGWKEATTPIFYTSRPNDTLYSIAWNFNLNVTTLAELNHLSLPYSLKPGTKIRLNPAHSTSIPPQPSQTFSLPKTKMVWRWPTKGKLKNAFHKPDIYQKGLEIVGSFSQPIYAAADGVIVYCGSGLAAYGKLIIIKHENNYLSAYGHLDSFKVKEGEKVTRHTQIGSLGLKNQEPLLHFEIRYFGNPIDPQKLLSQVLE